MRIGIRRLRSTLKLIAAACGLFILLLVATQYLPVFRGAADETPLQVTSDDGSGTFADADEPAEVEDSLAFFEEPAFSGSATGRAPASPSHPPAAQSTIEVGLAESDIPLAPLPPDDAEDRAREREEVLRIHLRMSELERQIAELKSTAEDRAAADQARVAALAEQHQDLRQAFLVTSARVTEGERHLQAVQESLRELQTANPPTEEGNGPSSRISIRSVVENGEPRVMMEAHDASLSELFARLGEASGLNLLVSPDVAGTVSLHLDLPNAEAALEAVCRIHQCRSERTGNIVVISHHAVSEAPAKPQPPETVTKLYRLQHLSGAEIRPYVQALLTPGLGTVSFASIRERVARTEYRDPPRAILVKDTAKVISEVDRLILELDRPPKSGKALPPLFQAMLDDVPPSPGPRRPQPPVAAPIPVPARVPTPVPASVAVPVPAPVPQSLESLPTGPELPGPCLDCEEFEPPIIMGSGRQ